MAHESHGKSTHSLLAEYIGLLNQFGPDATQPAMFLELHKCNEELMDLAETAEWLKRALLLSDVRRDEADDSGIFRVNARE